MFIVLGAVRFFPLEYDAYKPDKLARYGDGDVDERSKLLNDEEHEQLAQARARAKSGNVCYHLRFFANKHGEREIAHDGGGVLLSRRNHDPLMGSTP